MKQVSANVIKNEQILLELERPGARSILSSWIIWLRCPEIAREAKPGQFVMVSCGEECTLPRPFSIHQVNDKGIALLFQVVGKGTAWLSQRQTSDDVDIFGPLGNGFSIYPTSNNLLLVAGGIGIAPLRFLADEAVQQGKQTTLLLGASSAVRLLPFPEDSSNHGLLTDGILPWKINIAKVTDDGSEGYKGLVTDLIVDYIDRVDQIFACGPSPMYKTMAQMPELKDKPVQVSLEVGMACGLGVCYGCSIRTKTGLKQVCKDGPVFNLEDILWDELLVAGV